VTGELQTSSNVDVTVCCALSYINVAMIRQTNKPPSGSPGHIELPAIFDDPYDNLFCAQAVRLEFPSSPVQKIDESYELHKEAEKSKFEISPLDGATITKNIATLYQLKPELVGELKVILGDQSKR